MPERPDSETRSTRDIILDAAERRFAERGFAGVSVREIAADAGLKNQASLYHHFKNKRALYEAVLARGLRPLIQVIVESGLADRAAPEGNYHFLDRIIDYLIEHRNLPWLIQRASLDDSRYLRNSLMRMMRPLYAEGLTVLKNAGGPWAPDDLPHLAAGLYNLIFGYFANTALFEMVLPEDPQSVDAIEHQRHFLKVALAVLVGNQPAQPTATKRRK